MDNQLKLRIINAFKSIDSAKLLNIAESHQNKLNQENVKSKGMGIWGQVTDADIEIQYSIIEYFNKIPELSGTFCIKSEEKIENIDFPENPSWVLIIDPLDGTNEFVKKTNKWGILIGAGEIGSEIFFSVCINADGDFFTNEYDKSEIKEGNEIDIFDYSNEHVENVFKQISSLYKGIGVVTHPSASYSLARIVKGKSKGLIWVPSDKGKKYYPLYDLLFLPILFGSFPTKIYIFENKALTVIVAESQYLIQEISSKLEKLFPQLTSCDKIEDILPTNLEN